MGEIVRNVAREKPWAWSFGQCNEKGDGRDFQRDGDLGFPFLGMAAEHPKEGREGSFVFRC